MVQVESVLMVTPLWRFPEQKHWAAEVASALAGLGRRVCLAGPGRDGGSHASAPGVEICSIPLPEPRAAVSAGLPLRLRGPLQALARRLVPQVVHYVELRWAALGVPEGVPATGWLADQEGSLCPATPFGFKGPGWFGRWLRARKARALQIAALARLAGLAVPEAAMAEAAARTQLRGMPLVHLLPDPEAEPEGHAAGLLRLWADLPF